MPAYKSESLHQKIYFSIFLYIPNNRNIQTCIWNGMEEMKTESIYTAQQETHIKIFSMYI